jgi:predicted nucleotidyltransferase
MLTIIQQMMNNKQQPLNSNQQQHLHDHRKRIMDRSDEDIPDEKGTKTGFNRQRDFLAPYDTLFRKSTLRIIVALGRQYSTKFHVRDLSRSLHYDVSMISKNLKYLENMTLVTSEEVGNLVFYKANMDNVLLRQMKICFTLLELAELIRKVEPVASTIMLYGSCATGEDTNTSDIDLFIETVDKDWAKEILNTCQNELTRTLSPVLTTPNETYVMKMKDKNLFESINLGISLKR